MRRSKTQAAEHGASLTMASPGPSQGTGMYRRGFIVLVTILILRIVATFVPTSWLWGLDSLADAPLWLRGLGLLLFALALVPRVWMPVWLWLRRWRGRPSDRILGLAGGSALLLLLVLLRCGHSLLGDAQTWVASLEKGVRAAGGAHREPLPQAVLAWVYRLFGSQLGARGSFTVTGLPLATGYLALGLLLARRLAHRAAGRTLVFTAIVVGGGLQLFAGYAEFYNFNLVAMLLFAWLGLRWCHRKGRLPVVAGAYVLAGLCHAQTIFAAPALLVLIVAAWRQRRRREALLSLGLVPVLAVLGLLILRYPFGEMAHEAVKPDSFLPPLGNSTGRTAYASYALPHLVELVNACLLIVPALPVVLLLGAGRARPDAKERWFLALLALGPLLFALVANPGLGMIRDWDIYVLPFTLSALWAAARAARALDETRSASPRSQPGPLSASPTPRSEAPAHVALIGALLLTCSLHAFFWLVNNHVPSFALERARRVAGNPAFFSRKGGGEIWRYLGSADLAAKLPERAVGSYLRSIEADPDERMSYRLAAGLLIERSVVAGRGVEGGIDDLYQALPRGKHRSAYADYGVVFAALAAGREDLSRIAAAKMVQTEPTNPELLAVFGDILRRAERDRDARAVYERVLHILPSQPRALIGLACLAGIDGNREDLMRFGRLAIEGSPWSGEAQQFAALVQQPGTLTPEVCRKLLCMR